MSGSNTTTGTATGSPVAGLAAAGTYTVQSATSLATAIGVNVATVGTLTGTQLTELGITTIRTTVTTAAQASALETLAAGGIKFDLVLGQTQTVADFMQYADAINAMTLTTTGSAGAVSHSVVMVEGPDLTAAASGSYTYTLVGNAVDTSNLAGNVATGNQGGAFATVELFQAATNRASSTPTATSSTGTSAAESAMNSATAIAGVVVLPYSTVGTTDVTSAGSYTSALNVNLGGAPISEPDGTVLSTAEQTAVTVSQNYNLPGSLTAVVSQAGASSAGGLLDLLLDTRASVTGTTTSTAGTPAMTTTLTVTAPASMTFLSALAATAAGTATGTVTAPTAIGLFDANGTLTAAGTALNNLERILVASSTTTSTATTGTAASTLTLSVGTYTAMTNVATNVAVFAAAGGGDNIVWWDNVDSATGTAGHGKATLGFNQVESSVLVFDPTKSASAIGTYANISSLDVTNFGDGPLVVQISNVAGTTTTGTASAVGTYAGVSATATTTVTGGSGGGTTTMTGGTGGVTTTMGASGGVTLTSTASMGNTITAPATGNAIVQSLGTDTVQAGGGLDVVYATGSAATVVGGSGNLIFVAGPGGNYTAGGGTGTNVLYGNSGTAVFTGGGTTNSILVAGTGNATLQGGTGSMAVLFGGTASNVLSGSTGGSDTLVGGTGTNTFNMTTGDIAFGGSNGGDTYNTGTASALIVEGPGAEKVVLGGGNATVFGGTGTDTYTFAKGLGGSASIIGFKAGDSLNLTGGFTAADATSATGSATTGSFGTILKLGDGTTINIFGANVSASQITVT